MRWCLIFEVKLFETRMTTDGWHVTDFSYCMFISCSGGSSWQNALQCIVGVLVVQHSLDSSIPGKAVQSDRLQVDCCVSSVQNVLESTSSNVFFSLFRKYDPMRPMWFCLQILMKLSKQYTIFRHFYCKWASECTQTQTDRRTHNVYLEKKRIAE